MKSYFCMILACLMATAVQAGNPKGVDRANLDTSVAPGVNFYKYACGGWQRNNPLDPQYARFGTFDQLRENSREQVKTIITGLGTSQTPGSIEQKVGDLYAMGMDSVRLNNEGAAPLAADLQSLRLMQPADVMKWIGWMHVGLGDPFFNSSVMADLKDSDTNLLYLMQGGLGMGDRDYYLENDASTTAIRKAYQDYIQRVLILAGYKKGDAKKAMKAIMEIETLLARNAMTREETRDYSKLYNLTTVDQLKADYPHIDWNMYFHALGVDGVQKVCVFQPQSLVTVDNILATMPQWKVRDYLIYNYVNAAASYLSDDFVMAHFDMYSRAMSGMQMIQPRWKRALDVPNTRLGEAVGQLYVERYFPAESKKKMQRLVDNLRVALGEHIQSLEWMSPDTKVNALVKLNSFTVKIGYPDQWRDYSGVSIDPANSYWHNVRNLNRFNAQYEYDQLFKPVDKERWFMTPQTVNAYYEPSSNEICFPAAILQPPYFDPEADDASNYGAIGVVIGHEMTHGFDDQGRNFDHKGNMVDWWTADDAAKFKELADKLGAQYSAEIVADDVHANGNFTMGENIADHGGLRVSYTAFKHTDQGKDNKPIDGFTPDQRFFLSYANVWAANITKEEILRRTKVDPHSLGVNRVNVAIRNLEPFFNAFGIHDGDPMYRDPADRVTIW